MFLEKLNIHSISKLKIAPNEKREAELYSRIGYRLEEALADLVDNSIDAEAKHVLLRFQKFDDGIHSIVIADDGDGMDAENLTEAMRIGSRSDKGPSQLGKYGTGLKSASLSQAKTLTVLSRHKGVARGMRWRAENIGEGWMCEELSPSQCAEAMNVDLGPVKNQESGTMVIWERLEHLRAAKSSTDQILNKARKLVSSELGIRFHRLLEANTIKIWLDEVSIVDETAGVAIPVLALNPFSHGGCGHAAYPVALDLKLPKHASTLRLDLDIWPPKSNLSGYKLGGGKVASRQGFYFYRNDRLIQAGGWNGLVGDNSEPHLSLARVAIDLPPELESLFKLDIGKSLIDPPAEFSVGLETGETGAIFKKYLKDAEATYRRKKKEESAKFGFTAGAGFPETVKKKIRAVLSEKGLPKPAEVQISWNKLPADELFRIEPSAQQIKLNKTYQQRLEKAVPGAATMIKALFLLLAQDDLKKSYLTETSRDRIRRMNQALLAAIPE